MLYARDHERARIGELLDGARSSRSGISVLRGEPGIAKTALLEDTRGRAADMQVATRALVAPARGLHACGLLTVSPRPLPPVVPARLDKCSVQIEMPRV